MQIMYGELLALDANGKPIPPLAYRIAKDVVEWNNVVSIRIGLLFTTVANTADGQYGTEKEETGSEYNVNGEQVKVPVGQERRLRRVFVTTVALRNSTSLLAVAP